MFSTVHLNIYVVFRQLERVSTTLLIVGDSTLKDHRLDQSFLFSNNAIKNVSAWSDSTEAAHKLDVAIRSNRQHLLAENLTVADNVAFYSDAVAGFLQTLVASVRDTPTLEAWRMLLAYRLLVRANEDHSVAGLLGLRFFTAGGLSLQERNEFIELGAFNADHVKMSKQYSIVVQDLYRERYQVGRYT